MSQGLLLGGYINPNDVPIEHKSRFLFLITQILPNSIVPSQEDQQFLTEIFFRYGNVQNNINITVTNCPLCKAKKQQKNNNNKCHCPPAA